MSKSILIAGGTGLVGKKLTAILVNQGYKVSVLSRSEDSASEIPKIKWDVKKGLLDEYKLKGFSVIINLAGAGIIEKKWTAERKKEIIDSRVKSTQLLRKALEKIEEKPQLFISASAIGYYGFNASNTPFTEGDLPSADFVGETCVKWEAAADEMKELGIQVAKVRIGIVLSKEGGALPKMALPIKLGFGSPLASGKQYISWIHEEDLCQVFVFILKNKLTGAYNAVSPNGVTNKAFTIALAKLFNRPLFLPNVPAFIMNLMLGERADMVIKGNLVSPEKLEKAGFKFQYEKVELALKAIYS